MSVPPFEQEHSIAKLVFIPISHLFILPGAFFAWKLKLYDVFIVILMIFVLSDSYHFIEYGIFDITDIYIFWLGDYAGIFLGLLVMLMVWLSFPIELRYYITLPTIVVTIFIGKLFHDTVVLFVLIAFYAFEMIIIHKLYMMQTHGVGILSFHIANLFFFAFLACLVGMGIFFLYWAGDPGYRYYFWRHLAGWHIPIFSAISLALGYLYLLHYSKGISKKHEETLPIISTPPIHPPPNVYPPTNLIVRSGLPEEIVYEAPLPIRRFTPPTTTIMYPPNYEGL